MEMKEKGAAELQALLNEKEEEIAILRRQVERLREQLRLMQGRRFGMSSERTQTILDNMEQISLFNETESLESEGTPEPEPEQVTYRRKKRKGKREIDFSGLPVEQIVHELPEDERICPECGTLLHACGHQVLRRELAYVPAQYKVVEHVQSIYSCRHCEQTNDHVPVQKSPVPAPLIPGSGVASPSLLAHIMNNKYTLALPLYRQEQELMRNVLAISRQTMANWILFAHKHYFSPLMQTLREKLLDNEILHADETTLQVLREDKKKCYVWVYRTSNDTKQPVILYDYQPSRAGECASTFLAGFSGLLHTDGYEAYHCKLPPEITAVGCWAHMRRKFSDTLKSLPKEIREKHAAYKGLGYCNQLFALEENYTENHLSFQKRYNERLQRSKPVAEKFFAWARAEQGKNPVPKTMYGTALGYAINQEKWLMNVFLDGRLELSNNRAERSVRPFALGRKNWLFCNTPAGADASAAVYSIVETAKANGLRPFRYLNFLLERLPYGYSLDDCMPWGMDAQSQCK